MLGTIANEIGDFCAKWGRIPVTQTKEKYGTIRVYNGFGISGLHGLLFPRHVYKHRRFPQWLWKLDIFYISKVFEVLNKVIVPYQFFIYKLAFFRAMWKYPAYTKKIFDAADHEEAMGYELKTLCNQHSYTILNGSKYYIGNIDNCYLCIKEKDVNESNY